MWGMTARPTLANPLMKRNGLLRDASQPLPHTPLNNFTGSRGMVACSSP